MQNKTLDSPTFVEIDLSAYRHNMSEIKKKIPKNTGIIAVVKANAYGHGAVEIAKEALKFGVSLLAVARLGEAKFIRQEEIECPILLFGCCDMDFLSDYLKNDIRPTINSFNEAEELSRRCLNMNKTIKIHVKLDTGMGRHGLYQCSDDVVKIIEKMTMLPCIEIEGIYSHFANSDSLNKDHAMKQLSRFNEIKSKLDKIFKDKFLFHLANSAGVMDLPESHFDLVRPGIIMYGLNPSDETQNDSMNLKPVMSFKTRISQVKEVDSGFPVSYGSTYITDKKTIIATIPVGYADGYNRLLSSKGEMLVKGQRAPVIGRVCMDLTMIDVTNIPGVKQGDEVVIFGSQKGDSISVDELAKKIGTINYEIVSMISPRVPRVYKE